MTPGLRTNWSLSHWQQYLGTLYKEQNEGRVPSETFARLVEMSSGVARGVREKNPELLKIFVPRTLAWLLGLATRLEIDMEDAVWSAYPGVCTHCHQTDGCVCRIRSEGRRRLKDVDEIRSLQRAGAKPASLPKWQAMFRRIYAEINDAIGPNKCVLHFLEELGEVSEAMRLSAAPDAPLSKSEANAMLRNEMSDLFAWFCGLTNMENVEIDAYLKDIYQPGCPECHKSPCECDPHHVHSGVRLGGKGI